MNNQKKRNMTGHKKKISDHLLSGNELDRTTAASNSMGMDLPTRISNLRIDYGMKISQRPVSDNRPNGPFVYFMTQEQIKKYQSTNVED